LAEADESDARFLYLTPILAVVTNIDADHMETYGHDFNKLKQRSWISSSACHLRAAILCSDDENVREILSRISKPITTYGLAKNLRSAQLMSAMRTDKCALPRMPP